MFDLGLFRKPSFVGASAVAFCLSAGMFAMFLYLTIYMQDVLGYSPLEAGVRFLPLTLMSFIVAPIAGQLLEALPAALVLRRGPGARRVRPAADARRRRGFELDDAAAPASSSPAPASG